MVGALSYGAAQMLLGAGRGCECVGYQGCDHNRHETPNLAMNNLVETVSSRKIRAPKISLHSKARSLSMLANFG
jgi:hypothetical protein